MLRVAGPSNVPIMGFVRSLINMFFLSVHHMILRHNFWRLPEASSYSSCTEAFCHDST